MMSLVLAPRHLARQDAEVAQCVSNPATVTAM
jgi:hypothetical protein